MSQDEADVYSFEQAAESLGVSVADIESYVAEGLFELPADEAGRRLLTRVEMRRLWSVVTLHRDLGINLPGVAAVLRLREQFEAVRRDLATLVEIVEQELGADAWDRLWPEGRPKPTASICIEGVSDLSDALEAGGRDETPAPDAAGDAPPAGPDESTPTERTS